MNKNNRPPTVPTFQNGFTLIELLVVLAIIAVLAAILLPIFGTVKRNGMQTRCASNLRQVGVAMNLHASENNNLYPFMYGDPAGRPNHFTTWISRLQPYLNNKGNVGREAAADFMSCPAKTQTAASNVATFGINSYMGTGFIGTPDFLSANANWAYSKLRVTEPSKIILVGDIQGANSEVMPTSDKRSFLGNQSYGPGFRHGGKDATTPDKYALANVVFCDGHVESLNYNQLLLNPPDLASQPVGMRSRWKWW